MSVDDRAPVAEDQITVTGTAQQRAWRERLLPPVEQVRPGFHAGHFGLAHAVSAGGSRIPTTPMTTGTLPVRRREHHKSLTTQLRVCRSHRAAISY